MFGKSSFCCLNEVKQVYHLKSILRFWFPHASNLLSLKAWRFYARWQREDFVIVLIRCQKNGFTARKALSKSRGTVDFFSANKLVLSFFHSLACLYFASPPPPHPLSRRENSAGDFIVCSLHWQIVVNYQRKPELLRSCGCPHTHFITNSSSLFLFFLMPVLQ